MQLTAALCCVVTTLRNNSRRPGVSDGNNNNNNNDNKTATRGGNLPDNKERSMELRISHCCPRRLSAALSMAGFRVASGPLLSVAATRGRSFKKMTRLRLYRDRSSEKMTR